MQPAEFASFLKLKHEMVDDVDKDYIEALLKRNYTMQEISDLLRKRNPYVRGFSLRSVQHFFQDHDLSSREIINSELQNIVREVVEKV